MVNVYLTLFWMICMKELMYYVQQTLEVYASVIPTLMRALG